MINLTSSDVMLSPYESLRQKLVTGWSGNSLASDMGYLRNAITTATVQSSIKRIGTNALQFNNQNVATSIRLNESLKALPQFSISFWQYCTTFNYGGAFASWDANSVATGQLLFINNSGGSPSQFAFLAASGSAAYEVGFPSGAIPTNTWVHFICELDKLNNKIRVCSDNNSWIHTEIPSDFILNLGGDNFSLGGYSLGDNSISNMMNGYLDEFLILAGNVSESEKSFLASGETLT